MKSLFIFLILFLTLPYEESLASGLDNIENWDNMEYWIKRAKGNQKFYCGIIEIELKKNPDDQKSAETYQAECSDVDLYVNSNLISFTKKQKIIACTNFFNRDSHHKEIKKLSKNRKAKIYQDCRSFYNEYSDDQKLITFGHYYKAFYFDGFSKKEIDYNSKQTSNALKYCRQKYLDFGKKDQYDFCRMLVYRELDIYKDIK